MSEVRRYKYGYRDDGNGQRFLGLIESPEGSVVLASDYDQLKAENERLKCVVERLNGEGKRFIEQQRRAEGNRLANEEYHRDRLELRKQLAAAPQPSDDVAKDAARYRWLKDQKRLSLRSCGDRWTRKDGSQFVSSHRLAAGDTLFWPKETLDEAIDAAMEGEG